MMGDTAVVPSMSDCSISTDPDLTFALLEVEYLKLQVTTMNLVEVPVPGCRDLSPLGR
jgi:hypothetical protein